MSFGRTGKSVHRFQENFEDEDFNIDEYLYEQVSNNREMSPVTRNKYSQQQELPVQLIKKNPNGKFEVNPDAIQLISTYDKPASFVCLAGKYRTGKSFLLNKLLNLKGKGFKVSSSTDACTEGIWMWSRPIYNEKQGSLMFIIDTEGSEAANRNAQHDAKIFTLGILISSYFIYNSVGAIDEQSINELNLVSTLSKGIASGGNITEESLHRYMPKFLWLLRDFILQIKDQAGKVLSPSQYLQKCLDSKRGTQQSKNTKRALQTVFRDRDCMMLVRPAEDEKDLKNMENVPDAKIRPEFKDGMVALRNKILNNASPKIVNGQMMTSQMLCQMVQNYVASINQGAIPNITSAWDHIGEEAALEAYDAALQAYNLKYDQHLREDEPKRDSELQNILKEMRDIALDTFDYNVESPNEDLRNKLKAFLDEKQNTIMLINQEFNQAFNIRLLTEYSQKLIENVRKGEYNSGNAQTLNYDLKRMITRYNQDAQGNKKCQVLTLFLTNFNAMILKSYNDSTNAKMQSRHVQQDQTQRIKLDHLQQVKVLEERLERTQQQLITKGSQAQREIREQKRKLEQVRNQHLATKKQLDAILNKKKTKCCFF